MIKLATPHSISKIFVLYGNTYIIYELQDSVHSTSQSVVVNVNDLPDTPPVWTSIFSTEQFDEKTEKVITNQQKQDSQKQKN